MLLLVLVRKILKPSLQLLWCVWQQSRHKMQCGSKKWQTRLLIWKIDFFSSSKMLLPKQVRMQLQSLQKTWTPRLQMWRG